MLKILSLSIMTSTFLFFTGCGDVEDTYTPPKNPSQSSTTYISGKATLVSVSNSEAIACLDTNNNKSCDSDEPSTIVDNEGMFNISTQSNVEDGMLIIVTKGHTIIPFKDADEALSRNLKFYKSYQADDDQQNVNIISTLIAEKLESNGNGDYQYAIDTFSNQYPNYINHDDSWIDNRIPKDDLLLDPIDEAAGWFFKWLGGDEDLLKLNAALQNIVKEEHTIDITAKAPSRVVSNTSDQPEESALDIFYSTSDAYFSELLSFVEEFINWISSVGDDETVTESQPPVVTPPEVTQEKITSAKINGFWYIIDKSGDKTCAHIDGKDISVTEADGKTTKLSLTYKQINPYQASILLKLGFFTADTIVFDKYMNNNTFKGHYTSDGETLDGARMSSVQSCKTDKLGL